MSLTFEQAYEFTSKIGSHTSYDLAECRLLFTVAMRIPMAGVMVEIGCEYGRSSSILLQVAKARGAELHLVEPDPKPELLAMLRSLEYPFLLNAAKSIDAYALPDYADLAHIDGDHSYEAVLYDLEMVSRFTHGYIICHDYQRESLPEVTRAVDEFLAEKAGVFRINDKAETALCLTNL